MWAIVDCDRHTEPQIHLFEAEAAANAEMQEWFAEWTSDYVGEEWLEEAKEDGRVEGVWRYSTEGDYMYVVEIDLPSVYAAAPAMYELLKEHQFDGVQANGDDPCYNCCPSCQQMQEDGHSTGCRLAAVLKAVQGDQCSPATED